MTRTIQAENEACPITSSKQDQGTGTHVLNLRTQKPAQAGIIDADECQARHAAAHVARMQSPRRHISPITEA